MLYEKKKILTRRYVLLGILLLGIITSVIIAGCFFIDGPPKKLEIKEDYGSINDYDESLDKTRYYISILCEQTFNSSANFANAKVAFYDADGNMLEETETTFSGTEGFLSAELVVNGKVAYHKITDYDIKAVKNLRRPLFAALLTLALSFLGRDMFILGFFIASLFLSYKEYEYNGNKIVVYAGWYHNYIKLNGTKISEQNTLMPFQVITLSCKSNEGDDIQATISMTNKISLKINEQTCS